MNASQVPVRAGLDCDVTVTVDLTDETLAYRNILHGHFCDRKPDGTCSRFL